MQLNHHLYMYKEGCLRNPGQYSPQGWQTRTRGRRKSSRWWCWGAERKCRQTFERFRRLRTCEKCTWWSGWWESYNIRNHLLLKNLWEEASHRIGPFVIFHFSHGQNLKAVYSILLGQNLPHCRMWWTRHQGRSRWSRSGRERWRGWGTHRRRTGMRRSCDSAWHRLSNFENLVGNTVDNHSEGGMLYVFSSNQGLYLSPWVRSLHWINLFKKNGTFQLNSQTNLFSVKKLTSTVFLSFRVSSSTIGTFNPKEFKIICQKRKKYIEKRFYFPV